MKVAKNKNYEYKIWELGDLKRAFKSVIELLGIEVNSILVEADKFLANDIRTDVEFNIHELSGICKLDSELNKLTFRSK